MQPTCQHHTSELQLRVDFFRKLGYSPQEVQAALLKLGLGTDTNTVLGELVRTGARASPTANQEAEEGGSPQVHWWGGSTRSKETPRDTWHSAQEDMAETNSELKPIVIDGSNVAMSHGNKEVFSCRGIELAVNYFLERGHRKITVFVPSWRKEQPRPDVPISDQPILEELERKKIVVFTPSRRVGGKRVVCYDDRFIVKLAHELEGIIVSNDTYRDLQAERPEWKRLIEEGLLMYSFVNDKFMPPEDPLGRHGPNLDNFLRKKPLLPDHKRQLCPYGKKCTYGIKCKYYHPERTNQSQRSLADELRDNARLSSPVHACSENGGGVVGSRRGTYRCEPGFACASPSLELELEHKLTLEPNGCLPRSQLSNSMLNHWDDLNSGKKHASNPASHNAPLDHHSLHSLFLTNSSQFSSDSGLDSFDSQFSDTSGFEDSGYRVHFRNPSTLSYDQQDASYLCNYSSDPAVPAGLHQHSSPLTQSNSFGYSMLPYRRLSPMHYSLPNFVHPDGFHPSQQKAWSDTLWLQQTRTAYSLPDPLHGAGLHRPAELYGNSQTQREEARKKLKAIFNPYDVDKVMGMFPELKDAEVLAAEILKLKCKGEL
ncbi:ribonuclease ZC3H12A [Electrophorus electricus]|uniref:C3H1-type domain-containing protein n=1 Tax=Electrophorus electricus TaxID=8005 RepID=A0A4W4HQH5_ELEEL|nr:ribonuclease ZC3H12A [Electrophorus electricus]